MDIVLSNTNQNPIYEQICIQIKQQILDGTLTPEQPLPSIRSLAKELRISVITTKRAYEELERDGYIETVAGKGSFVARPDTGRVRREYLERVRAHLLEAVRLAPSGGLDGAGLIQLLEQVLREESL